MEIKFLPLCSSNLNDFEMLFNSCDQCKECWCMNHRLDPKDVLIGEAAKMANRKLVNEDKIFGILAYLDEECIGWCAVDPLKNQLGHDYCLEKGIPDDLKPWSIHCVYIKPSARGKGISAGLVNSALKLAKQNGAKEVYSFPIPEENISKFPKDEAEFSGRSSTFRKLGFSKIENLNAFYDVYRIVT